MYPLPALDALAFSKLHIHEVAPTDGSGKRKVDGSYADTRLGKALTPRWANERFRQVMMLVLEFRVEWSNQSLLSVDDVQFIRMAIDTALAMAEREEHTSDIYDVNPTTWSIWLVQHTIATRAGGWTAESVAATETFLQRVVPLARGPTCSRRSAQLVRSEHKATAPPLQATV